MNRHKIALKSIAFLLLLVITSLNSTAIAQEDLGLCPDPFTQGFVSTGFVDCNEPSNSESSVESAEENRIEFEAICNATPNAEVTSSEIKGTSNGRFYADVTCTITRNVPPGTTLCPDGSQEYQRAFDNVICMYFGMAELALPDAQAELTTQTSQCAAEGGSVLQSLVEMGVVESDDDEIAYFVAQSACILDSIATDVIECPFGFEEDDRDENLLECEFEDRTLESLVEAQDLTQTMESICTDTTAGLGTVTASLSGMTTIPSFFSEVYCQISIPRYGDFVDDSIVRACDETCTEDVEQIRMCLNGGEVGGPGCTEDDTQTIERSCNTGPDPAGLCPLPVSTTTVIPLLLLDDEEESQ
ncbi:MAG: hypothetical protein KTR16_09810 [Acidiferrobacterales bacterium]|nr:hypothetical protein [Acidiferrobacterales bacterium]